MSSSSSRNTNSRNASTAAVNLSPSIANGSSGSTMMDHHRDSNHRSANHRDRYLPDDQTYQNDAIIFHRSNSSRTKGSSTLSTSSSASSSPSLSLQRDGSQRNLGSQPDSQPSRGNLVKHMVDNMYTNTPIKPSNSQHGLVINPSVVRSSFRGPSAASNGAPTYPMSPSTAQRSFVAGLKTQLSESGQPPSQHNYDNLSPVGSYSKGSRHHQDSPSLDRKSITRASLPIGSAHPYYHRSGSGISSASSNASGNVPVPGIVGQLYGQINASSSKGSVKAYLDGDPVMERHT